MDVPAVSRYLVDITATLAVEADDPSTIDIVVQDELDQMRPTVLVVWDSGDWSLDADG